eukprot:GEMP01000015.1.p1 GENE.GEMP01000015.1~~GEMP01000015.1.p1  ORF type:complete len:4377 (+),score=1023.35 GEMP01000015.1:350-13480(+)
MDKVRPGDRVQPGGAWANGQLAQRMEAGFSDFVVARLSPKDLREALGISYPQAVMLIEQAKERYPDPLLQAVRDMQHNVQVWLHQIAQHQAQIRDEVHRIATHAQCDGDVTQNPVPSAFRDHDMEHRTDPLPPGFSSLGETNEVAPWSADLCDAKVSTCSGSVSMLDAKPAPHCENVSSVPSAHGAKKFEENFVTHSSATECPARAQTAHSSIHNEPVLCAPDRMHSHSNFVAPAAFAPLVYPTCTAHMDDGTLIRDSDDAKLRTTGSPYAIPSSLSSSSDSDTITAKVSAATELQHSDGCSVANDEEFRPAPDDDAEWQEYGTRFVRALACINSAEVPDDEVLNDEDLDEAGRSRFFISFIREQVLLALNSSPVRQALLSDDIYAYLLSLKAQTKTNSSHVWTEPFPHRALQYLRAVSQLCPEPFNARAYAHASQLNAQCHLDTAEDEAQLRALLEAESHHTVLSWEQYWELLLTGYFFSCLSIDDVNHSMAYPRAAYFMNDMRLRKEQRTFSDRQILNMSSALVHLLRVVLDVDVTLNRKDIAAPALALTPASTRASVSASACAPTSPPAPHACTASVPCTDTVVPTTPATGTTNENTLSVPKKPRAPPVVRGKADEGEALVTHITYYHATADDSVAHRETRAAEPAGEDGYASFQDVEEGDLHSLSSVGYLSVPEVPAGFRMPSAEPGLCAEDADATLNGGDATVVECVAQHIDGDGTSAELQVPEEDQSVEFHTSPSIYSQSDEGGDADTVLNLLGEADDPDWCEDKYDGKEEGGDKGQDDFEEEGDFKAENDKNQQTEYVHAEEDERRVLSRTIRTWRANARYRRRCAERDAFLRRRILFRWRAEVGFILMGRRVTRKYIENCASRCWRYWHGYVAHHMRPLRREQQRSVLRMIVEREGMSRALAFGEWWNVKEREALQDADMAFQVGEITERYTKQYLLLPLLRAWQQLIAPVLARALSARICFTGRFFRAWREYVAGEMQEIKDKMMALQLNRQDKIMSGVMREWLSSCIRFPTPAKLYGSAATRNTMAPTVTVVPSPSRAQHTAAPPTTAASSNVAPPASAPPAAAPPPSAAARPPSIAILAPPTVSASIPAQVKPKEAPAMVLDNTYPIQGLPHQGEAHCYVGGSIYESFLSTLKYETEEHERRKANGFLSFECMDISQTPRSVDDLNRFFSIISGKVHILRLKLYKTDLTDEKVISLCSFLRSLPSPIRELHVSHGYLTSIGIQRLMESMEGRSRHSIWFRFEHNCVSTEYLRACINRKLICQMETDYGTSLCDTRQVCKRGAPFHTTFAYSQVDLNVKLRTNPLRAAPISGSAAKFATGATKSSSSGNFSGHLRARSSSPSTKLRTLTSTSTGTSASSTLASAAHSKAGEKQTGDELKNDGGAYVVNDSTHSGFPDLTPIIRAVKTLVVKHKSVTKVQLLHNPELQKAWSLVYKQEMTKCKGFNSLIELLKKNDSLSVEWSLDHWVISDAAKKLKKRRKTKEATKEEFDDFGREDELPPSTSQSGATTPLLSDRSPSPEPSSSTSPATTCAVTLDRAQTASTATSAPDLSKTPALTVPKPLTLISPELRAHVTTAVTLQQSICKAFPNGVPVCLQLPIPLCVGILQSSEDEKRLKQVVKLMQQHALQTQKTASAWSPMPHLALEHNGGPSLVTTTFDWHTFDAVRKSIANINVDTKHADKWPDAGESSVRSSALACWRDDLPMELEKLSAEYSHLHYSEGEIQLYTAEKRGELSVQTVTQYLEDSLERALRQFVPCAPSKVNAPSDFIFEGGYFRVDGGPKNAPGDLRVYPTKDRHNSTDEYVCVMRRFRIIESIIDTKNDIVSGKGIFVDECDESVIGMLVEVLRKDALNSWCFRVRGSGSGGVDGDYVHKASSQLRDMRFERVGGSKKHGGEPKIEIRRAKNGAWHFFEGTNKLVSQSLEDEEFFIYRHPVNVINWDTQDSVESIAIEFIENTADAIVVDVLPDTQLKVRYLDHSEDVIPLTHVRDDDFWGKVATFEYCSGGTKISRQENMFCSHCCPSHIPGEDLECNTCSEKVTISSMNNNDNARKERRGLVLHIFFDEEYESDIMSVAASVQCVGGKFLGDSRYDRAHKEFKDKAAQFPIVLLRKWDESHDVAAVPCTPPAIGFPYGGTKEHKQQQSAVGRTFEVKDPFFAWKFIPRPIVEDFTVRTVTPERAEGDLIREEMADYLYRHGDRWRSGQTSLKDGIEYVFNSEAFLSKRGKGGPPKFLQHCHDLIVEETAHSKVKVRMSMYSSDCPRCVVACSKKEALQFLARIILFEATLLKLKVFSSAEMRVHLDDAAHGRFKTRDDAFADKLWNQWVPQVAERFDETLVGSQRIACFYEMNKFFFDGEIVGRIHKVLFETMGPCYVAANAIISLVFDSTTRTLLPELRLRHNDFRNSAFIRLTQYEENNADYTLMYSPNGLPPWTKVGAPSKNAAVSLAHDSVKFSVCALQRCRRFLPLNTKAHSSGYRFCPPSEFGDHAKEWEEGDFKRICESLYDVQTNASLRAVVEKARSMVAKKPSHQEEFKKMTTCLQKLASVKAECTGKKNGCIFPMITRLDGAVCGYKVGVSDSTVLKQISQSAAKEWEKQMEQTDEALKLVEKMAQTIKTRTWDDKEEETWRCWQSLLLQSKEDNSLDNFHGISRSQVLSFLFNDFQKKRHVTAKLRVMLGKVEQLSTWVKGKHGKQKTLLKGLKQFGDAAEWLIATTGIIDDMSVLSQPVNTLKALKEKEKRATEIITKCKGAGSKQELAKDFPAGLKAIMEKLDVRIIEFTRTFTQDKHSKSTNLSKAMDDYKKYVKALKSNDIGDRPFLNCLQQAIRATDMEMICCLTNKDDGFAGLPFHRILNLFYDALQVDGFAQLFDAFFTEFPVLNVSMSFSSALDRCTIASKTDMTLEQWTSACHVLTACEDFNEKGKGDARIGEALRHMVLRLADQLATQISDEEKTDCLSMQKMDARVFSQLVDVAPEAIMAAFSPDQLAWRVLDILDTPSASPGVSTHHEQRRLQFFQRLISTHHVATTYHTPAGETLLHLALHDGKLEAAKLIHTTQPSLATVRDAAGRTICHAAVHGGTNCVLWAKTVCSLDTRDIGGWGPLQYALQKEWTDFSVFDPGHWIEEDTCGWTPCAELLLWGTITPTLSALVTDLDVRHKPLQAAVHANDIKLVTHLLSSTAKDGSVEPISAIDASFAEIAGLRCEDQFLIPAAHSWVVKETPTPLHVACKVGSVQLVQYMIERKARIGAVTKESNETPLHLAAVNGSSEVCELLVHHGAQWWGSKVKNAKNKTPLEVATGEAHRILRIKENQRRRTMENHRNIKVHRRSPKMVALELRCDGFDNKVKVLEQIHGLANMERYCPVVRELAARRKNGAHNNPADAQPAVLASMEEPTRKLEYSFEPKKDGIAVAQKIRPVLLHENVCTTMLHVPIQRHDRLHNLGKVLHGLAVSSQDMKPRMKEPWCINVKNQKKRNQWFILLEAHESLNGLSSLLVFGLAPEYIKGKWRECIRVYSIDVEEDDTHIEQCKEWITNMHLNGAESMLERLPEWQPLAERNTSNSLALVKWYSLEDAYLQFAFRPSGKEAGYAWPFLLDEVEYELLDSMSKDMQIGPVMLIGRAGTGKTECVKEAMRREILNDSDDTMCYVTRSDKLLNDVESHINGFYALHNKSRFDDNNVAPTEITSLDDFAGAKCIMLTSMDFLRALDATFTTPFFADKDDIDPTIFLKKDDLMVWTHTLTSLRRREEEGTEDAEGNLQCEIPLGAMSNSVREVTFAKFSKKFFPNEKPAVALEFWVEIQSRIKGSVCSLYQGRPLTASEYQDMTNRGWNDKRGNTMLMESRDKVWDFYQKYEKWCKKECLWDAQDFMLHVHNVLEKEGYRGPKIDRFFIDEVQDLTIGQIFIFLRLSHKLFLAGDTAQCIIPGIRFRFKDLCSDLWRERRNFFSDRLNNKKSVIEKSKLIEIYTCSLCNTTSEVTFNDPWHLFSCNGKAHHDFFFCSTGCVGKFNVERGNSEIRTKAKGARARIDHAKGTGSASCPRCDWSVKPKGTVTVSAPVDLCEGDVLPQPIEASASGLQDFSDAADRDRIYQLGTNYRLTMSILHLENQVLDLLSKHFLDRMEKLENQIAHFQGEPPIYFNDPVFEDVLQLFGNALNDEQAILVRNEETARELRAKKYGGLIMTIQEAKGLDFKDVIVYDFIKDSPAPTSAWSLLRNQDKFDISKHELLCDELKMFVTAMTRAKERLMFFESNNGAARDEQRKREEFTLRDHFYKFLKISGCVSQHADDRSILERENTAEGWRRQGRRMLRGRRWEQAAFCFANSHDFLSEALCQAYYHTAQNNREAAALFFLEAGEVEKAMQVLPSIKNMLPQA